jgi:N-acyl-D-amino-acid deacylase
MGEHARVHVSHMKSVYGHGVERAEEILAVLDRARAAGIEVTADVYPYTASYTGLAILFPVWAKTEADFIRARSERRAELEDWLVARVERRNGPEATLLGTAPWTGRTLAEVAFEREQPFEDVLIDVIGPQGASAAYFVMDEALQSRLLEDPMVAIGSDGSPGAFHPRGYGSFAKVIEKYVVAERRLTLADAVRKMTSLPARILGLADRGELAEGRRADLVVFAPQAVHARADYTAPHRYAEGFDLVVVNGKVARENGELTGALPGRVLYPLERAPL